MASDYITSPPQIKIDVNPGKILFALGGLILLFGIFTSFYQVPAEAVTVIQRFGAYDRTELPGLHFKLPFGIETLNQVAIQRTLKLEFGKATLGATNIYQNSESLGDQEKEKSMVTGDLNSVMVEWVVQYHISDPMEFLFDFSQPEATLRDLAESVMREVVGDRSVDEVLTGGRQEIETNALARLETIVSSLKLGLHINLVQLADVRAPSAVRSSFDDVTKAQQERETAINTANGEYNRIIPSARGLAEKTISTAEGYAVKRVNEADGDAGRFTAVLKEYIKAPEVTRKRLYFETMAEILPTIPGKIILDDKAPHLLPMLQLKQQQGRAAASASIASPASQTQFRSLK
jgi:membrane protease subunit HflK